MPYYIVWKYVTETMVYTHRVTNKKHNIYPPLPGKRQTSNLKKEKF